MRLQGKTAIVTGSARGLGQAYAVRLAMEGAKVIVADILDGHETVEAVLRRRGEAHCVHTDVTSEQSTQEMAQSALERFGTIDILVNNAAMFGTIVKKPFFEISGSEWDDMMRVNLKGTFFCCKAVYPQMKKQGRGKIINVSSTTFFMGVPFFLHYVTSKGGIVGFTRALAKEVGGEGICVNAIAPGLTLSEAVIESATYSRDYLKVAASGRCFKRDQHPEDLLGAILFLASDESDFITGQTLVVDGGSVLH